MLDQPNNSDTVAWLPHGRGFVIVHKEAFETTILPRHFHKQSKYSSFTRKLNRWGFVRITRRGPETGAYYHPCFRRGEHGRVLQMSCRTGNNKGESSRTYRPCVSPGAHQSKVPITMTSSDGCSLVTSTRCATSESAGHQMLCMQNQAIAREILAHQMVALMGRSFPRPLNQGPSLASVPLLLQLHASEALKTQLRQSKVSRQPQWGNTVGVPPKPLLAIPWLSADNINTKLDA